MALVYNMMPDYKAKLDNLKSSENFEEKLYYMCEQSYFSGQRDAYYGDFRIKLNSDSIFVWTVSCWDNNRKPKYQPTYIDSKRDVTIP